MHNADVAERGLREIVVFPGSGDRSRAVERFAARGGLITSLNDARLPTLRELSEGSEAEVCLFGDLVGRVLRGAGEPTLALATAGQTKALVGAACRDLPLDSPLFDSGRFDGTHDCLVETLSELHRWGYRPEDLESIVVEGRSRDLLQAVAQVMRELSRGLEGLGRAQLSDRVDACFHLAGAEKPYFDRVLVDLGTERAPKFEAWLRWLADTGAHVEVLRESLEAPTTNWAKGLCGEPGGEAPEVEIVCAPDALSECEWALRACLEARQEGILDHRIAIVVRSRDDYGPLLLATASRLGVPIRAGPHVPLLANGLVSFVDTALAVAASGDVRRVAPLARRSYFGTPPEHRPDVEKAIREASRSGCGAWEVLVAWSRNNAVAAPWMAHFGLWATEARARPATLHEWIGRLRLLMDGGQLSDRVMANSTTAPRDLRAQASMERALLDFASAFPREGALLTIEDFAGLSRRIWEEQETVLPGAEVGIQVVGSTDQLGDCDVVIVLGMLEGVFPHRRSEDPILGDEDRRLLAAAGHEPLPLSHEIAARERQEFIHLCALPRRRLVLSYPLTGDNRDNIPAFYLKEVKNLLGERAVERVRRRADLAPASSLAAADHRLAQALAAPKQSPKPVALTAPEARQDIQPDVSDEGVDPREIALAFECPFRSVARHRLRVFQGTQRDPWREIWRIPIAAGLPLADDEQKAREALLTALDKELDRLTGELDPWQIRVIEGSATRLIDGWVGREFEAREKWGPRSVRTSVSFDDPELQNQIPLPGKRTARLVGKIDVMVRLEPYRGVCLYQARRPDLKKVDDKIGADQLLHGIELLTLSTPRGLVALEVDSSAGERHLYVVPRLDDVPLRSDLVCRVYGLADSWARYASLVKASLVEAVSALEQATMEAKPGSYCMTCDYGELCRSSIDFGDIEDPFFAKHDEERDDPA